MVDPIIVSHCGRTVKATGDGMSVEASAVDAMRCAVLLYSIGVYYIFRGKDRRGHG